jgi:ketosteroid isomerase-like protein
MAADTSGEFLDRLAAATTAHDLDGLVDCFTDDYELTQPTHPARSFTGASQVRANWTQIFASVPDLRASVTARSVAGSRVWSEWEMSGHRPDGSWHHMRGVMIFGLREGRAEWGRFYLEPVDEDETSIDEAVRRQVRAEAP